MKLNCIKWHLHGNFNDLGKRLTRSTGANRSSSGYVSCSECSYDSESCTCISADKCYCSLSRPSPGHETVRKNATVCACDTDSCSDSNKCYCTRRSMNQPTILEQLRQHGIVPSEETLSRRESPERTKPFKTGRSYASSRSLEFYKVLTFYFFFIFYIEFIVVYDKKNCRCDRHQ